MNYYNLVKIRAKSSLCYVLLPNDGQMDYWAPLTLHSLFLSLGLFYTYIYTHIYLFILDGAQKL